jgi:hypothetical protein
MPVGVTEHRLGRDIYTDTYMDAVSQTDIHGWTRMGQTVTDGIKEKLWEAASQSRRSPILLSGIAGLVIIVKPVRSESSSFWNGTKQITAPQPTNGNTEIIINLWLIAN